MDNNQNTGGGRLTGNEENPKLPLETQEKTSLGGAYNSGVTSEDGREKKEINKKATMYGKQPLSDKERQQDEQAKKNTTAPNNRS